MVIACKKEDPSPETFDHVIPTINDFDRAGVNELKLPGQAYIYFSKLIFINFQTDFWFFDSTTNHFSPKADFPGKDRISLQLVPFNQSIYGGLSKVQTNPRLDDWFIYDTLGNHWTVKLSCPFPIPNAMEGNKSGSGKILFSCPYAINGSSLCPVEYDVTNNSWSRNTKNCDSLAISCF